MSEILLAAGIALYGPLVFWVLRPVYGFFDLCPQRDASALEDAMRLLRAEAYMRRHPLLWVNLGALSLEISFFRDIKAGQLLFGGIGAGGVYLIQFGVLVLGKNVLE